MSAKYYPPRPFPIRFWEKVRKSPDCWTWVGCVARNGYGQVRGPQGLTIYAHRASYELLVGPIPKGLTLDHLCRNTVCVNPAHLEAVTIRTNVLRSDSASAQAARRTHCPQGHPYDEANTLVRPSGSRECRACKLLQDRARGRRYRERRKARAAQAAS